VLPRHTVRFRAVGPGPGEGQPIGSPRGRGRWRRAIDLRVRGSLHLADYGAQYPSFAARSLMASHAPLLVEHRGSHLRCSNSAHRNPSGFSNSCPQDCRSPERRSSREATRGADCSGLTRSHDDRITTDSTRHRRLSQSGENVKIEVRCPRCCLPHRRRAGTSRARQRSAGEPAAGGALKERTSRGRRAGWPEPTYCTVRTFASLDEQDAPFIRVRHCPSALCSRGSPAQGRYTAKPEQQTK